MKVKLRCGPTSWVETVLLSTASIVVLALLVMAKWYGHWVYLKIITRLFGPI